jgi:hypothetical protein
MLMTVRVDEHGRAYEMFCPCHKFAVQPGPDLYSSLPLLPLRVRGKPPSQNSVGTAGAGAGAGADGGASGKIALHGTPNKTPIIDLDCDEDDDAGALLDTSEKPERKRFKRLQPQRMNEGGNDDEDGDAERERRREIRRKKKNKRKAGMPLAVAKLFELEAEVSGSDSSDENEERAGRNKHGHFGDGSEESEQLSGNFINDGDYTQHSPSVRHDHGGGMALYYQVNRGLESQMSPMAGMGGSDADSEPLQSQFQSQLSQKSPQLRFGFRGAANHGLPQTKRLYKRLIEKQKRKAAESANKVAMAAEHGNGDGNGNGNGNGGDHKKAVNDKKNRRRKSDEFRSTQRRHRQEVIDMDNQEEEAEEEFGGVESLIPSQEHTDIEEEEVEEASSMQDKADASDDDNNDEDDVCFVGVGSGKTVLESAALMRPRPRRSVDDSSSQGSGYSNGDGNGYANGNGHGHDNGTSSVSSGSLKRMAPPAAPTVPSKRRNVPLQLARRPSVESGTGPSAVNAATAAAADRTFSPSLNSLSARREVARRDSLEDVSLTDDW